MRMCRRAIVALVALLASQQPAFAVECVFRSLESGSLVVRDSGERIDPSEWFSDYRCERLRLVVGRVRVVYRDAEGRAAKRELGAMNARLVAPAESAGSPLLDELRMIVSGDERVRAGRSRSGAGSFDALVAALPHGKVVRPDNEVLDVAVPLVADETDGVFSLRRDGAVVLTTRAVARVISVPTSALIAGRAYEWTFRTSTDVATGTFDVVSAEALGAVLRSQSAAAEDPDPLLARAALLLQNGYSRESRAVLRQWLDQ